MEERDHNVTIRLSARERSLLIRAAEHNGESISNLLRRGTIPLARRIAQRAEREARDNSAATAA